MDYYSLLGVSRNASDKDLKKAFKEKSMQHHPDRGGDAEKFKEINEAYQALKDPQKRQMYDQFGTTDPQQTGPQGFQFSTNGFEGMGGFEDLFAQFGFNQRRQKNDDITIAVELDISDLYTGKSYVVNYRLQSGRMETANIDVPAGVRPNDTIRYGGMGQDTLPGLPRGHLNVKIRVKANSEYRINGIDLITIKDVNVFHLITGTVLELHTPKGNTLKLTIPPKTAPGTKMGISGHGLPDRKTGRSGSIIIELNGVIPKDIPEELVNKIKEYW
jgi:curved DNA-binding protein